MEELWKRTYENGFGCHFRSKLDETLMKLGKGAHAKYYTTMKAFIEGALTKEELDNIVSKLLGGVDAVKYHNQFVLSILRNVMDKSQQMNETTTTRMLNSNRTLCLSEYLLNPYDLNRVLLEEATAETTYVVTEEWAELEGDQKVLGIHSSRTSPNQIGTLAHIEQGFRTFAQSFKLSEDIDDIIPVMVQQATEAYLLEILSDAYEQERATGLHASTAMQVEKSNQVRTTHERMEGSTEQVILSASRLQACAQIHPHHLPIDRSTLLTDICITKL